MISLTLSILLSFNSLSVSDNDIEISVFFWKFTISDETGKNRNLFWNLFQNFFFQNNKFCWTLSILISIDSLSPKESKFLISLSVQITPAASTPKPINSTAPTPYYGRLVEKEYTRNLTIGFLEYRGAFKKYVRFLFRSTQILNYFTEKQAEEVRKLKNLRKQIFFSFFWIFKTFQNFSKFNNNLNIFF